MDTPENQLYTIDAYIKAQANEVAAELKHYRELVSDARERVGHALVDYLSAIQPHDEVAVLPRRMARHVANIWSAAYRWLPPGFCETLDSYVNTLIEDAGWMTEAGTSSPYPHNAEQMDQHIQILLRRRPT